MKPTAKAIIFDMGNVLVHFDAVRAARQFSRLTKVPFKKVWRHFFVSKVEKAYTRGEITTREFYEHARKAFDGKVDFRTFQALWNDIFWENRGIRRILKRLERRYPLYLISNTNEMHFKYLKRRFPALFRLFTKTFPSHEVGYRKPDPRIFWKVLRTIRLEPSEVCFIDDMPPFIRAARAVGMRTIRFRSNAQLKRDLKRKGIQ